MERAISQESSTSSTKKCIACRNHFQEGEQLPLQDLRVQFKNFQQIPLKEPRHKYTLLKTINAFLNTKGGNIFLGVDDSNCRVKGYYLSLKQQDEFKFSVKGLTEKMQPKIDFSNLQEVSTVFLPVMNNGKFTGRYIIKIVVRQGKRDAVYTFSQKIKLVSTDKSESEEFEMRYAYKRVGPGGIEKLTPLGLLQEIYRKAKQPNEQYKIHEGCNPHPLEPEYAMKAVGFEGLYSRPLRQKLIDMFNRQLEKNPMECTINYDEETKVLLAQFQKEEHALRIKDLLCNHLDILKSGDIELEYVGPDQGTYLFKNKKKETQLAKEVSAEPQKVKQVALTEKKPSKAEEQSFYALTHINIHSRDKLMKILNGTFSKKVYGYEVMKNTIMIQCPSSQLEHVKAMIGRNEKELHTYGHNGRIVYGITTGHICIYNYTEKMRQQLKIYVEQILKGKILAWQFKKDNNDKTRSYIDLKLLPKDAVEALDQLLEDEEIRRFSLKGAKEGEMPKLKIMLKCNN